MNQHVNPFRAYIDATLERLGGLYTFDDIVEMVNRGDAQSFVYGDSWAVTQVHDTPRKRVLNIIFVAGRLRDIFYIENEIMDWAMANKVDLIIGHGRNEWEGLRRKSPMWGDLGWRQVSSLFMKDVDHA